MFNDASCVPEQTSNMCSQLQTKVASLCPTDASNVFGCDDKDAKIANCACCKSDECADSSSCRARGSGTCSTGFVSCQPCNVCALPCTLLIVDYLSQLGDCDQVLPGSWGKYVTPHLSPDARDATGGSHSALHGYSELHNTAPGSRPACPKRALSNQLRLLISPWLTTFRALTRMTPRRPCRYAGTLVMICAPTRRRLATCEVPPLDLYRSVRGRKRCPTNHRCLHHRRHWSEDPGKREQASARTSSRGRQRPAVLEFLPWGQTLVAPVQPRCPPPET